MKWKLRLTDQAIWILMSDDEMRMYVRWLLDCPGAPPDFMVEDVKWDEHSS